MHILARMTAIVLLPVAVLMADTTETRFFRGAMSPANEVPPVTGVTASAQATITAVVRRNDAGNVVSGTVYFDIDYSFGAPVTINGLHIHQGGAGVNGPIRIDTGIAANTTVDAEGNGNLFRVVEVSGGAALTALAGLLDSPSGFYVNLHTNANPGGLMRDQLQATVQPSPMVLENGVVNSASLTPGTNPVAPGSIATVLGKYLNNGPPAVATALGQDGKLATTLGGATVKLNGIAAPLFYSTFTQAGIQIPSELAGQTSASLEVTVGGKTSQSRSVALEAEAPGIFTMNQSGTGAAVAFRQQDFAPVSPSSPAQPGEVVVLFGTGLGATNPPLGTGELSAGNPVATSPMVRIDGVDVQPESAGRAPGFVGLDRIAVRIPAGARSASNLPVVLVSGARQSNTVTLAVAGSAPADNPVPAIISLSPNPAYVGDPAMTLVINGTGFVPTSKVYFNAVEKVATYVSDTRLNVAVPASDLAAQQVYSVRVENPPPGGGTSNTVSFSVVPLPPDPYDPYDDY